MEQETVVPAINKNTYILVTCATVRFKGLSAEDFQISQLTLEVLSLGTAAQHDCFVSRSSEVVSVVLSLQELPPYLCRLGVTFQRGEHHVSLTCVITTKHKSTF